MRMRTLISKILNPINFIFCANLAKVCILALEIKLKMLKSLMTDVQTVVIIQRNNIHLPTECKKRILTHLVLLLSFVI